MISRFFKQPPKQKNLRGEIKDTLDQIKKSKNKLNFSNYSTFGLKATFLLGVLYVFLYFLNRLINYHLTKEADFYSAPGYVNDYNNHTSGCLIVNVTNPYNASVFHKKSMCGQVYPLTDLSKYYDNYFPALARLHHRNISYCKHVIANDALNSFPSMTITDLITKCSWSGYHYFKKIQQDFENEKMAIYAKEFLIIAGDFILLLTTLMCMGAGIYSMYHHRFKLTVNDLPKDIQNEIFKLDRRLNLSIKKEKTLDEIISILSHQYEKSIKRESRRLAFLSGNLRNERDEYKHPDSLSLHFLDHDMDHACSEIILKEAKLIR